MQILAIKGDWYLCDLGEYHGWLYQDDVKKILSKLILDE